MDYFEMAEGKYIVVMSSFDLAFSYSARPRMLSD